jgi:hypothetical protein
MPNGEEIKKDPTFIEQAFSIIEENYPNDGAGYGMTINDHKLLVKILDTHEKYVDCKNSEFSQTLIEDVNEVIKDQWIRVLDEKLKEHSLSLNKTMSSIAGDIREIKIWKSVEEKRMMLVEERLERKRIAIKRIDLKIEQFEQLLQPAAIIEMQNNAALIKEIKPSLEKVASVLEWWSWRGLKKHWGKILFTLFVITILVTAIVVALHKLKVVTFIDGKQHVENKFTPEQEIQIWNAPTRAVHTLDVGKFTKKQQDSINDAIHEQNEKDILRSVEIRNKGSRQ